MGKFFKALEKAKNENVANPIPERSALERRTDSPSSKAKTVMQFEQSQVADHSHRDMAAVDRPIDAEPPTPPAIETIPETALTAIESVETSVKQNLAQPAIAEKLHPSTLAAEAGKRNKEPAVAGKTRSSEDVRVSYSRTKVQYNDPEKLKNNKIFSIFDEIETTDQIKKLRTQVLRKLKAIGGNSILVTSANPYEGKTFTSINLGVSIAKEFDRTVLIIDADIRKPTLQHTAFSTEFFSLKVEKGLTDYLMGEASISEILINPGIDKLTLIPGGEPVVNSPELLNSARMEEMMSEIKSRYPSDRVVIVDGPAILPFSDAMILSRYVDGVIPVVEVEKTSTDDLKKMMESLKETLIIGVVSNKSRG